jgi:hypothetical protein
MWGTLSDKRTGLLFAVAAGPCRCSHSWVWVPRDSCTYFTVSHWDFPNPEGQVPHIYIPQLYTPSHWVPVLLPLMTQGYGGGIQTRLHTGSHSAGRHLAGLGDIASGQTQPKTPLPTICLLSHLCLLRRSHYLVAVETFAELFPSNSRLLASQFGFQQTLPQYTQGCSFLFEYLKLYVILTFLHYVNLHLRHTVSMWLLFAGLVCPP